MTDTIPATVKTHTALPWADSKYGEICGPDGDIVPVYRFALSSSTTAKANAAFIVRACNSHYQLVSALQEAIEELWDRDHSSMDRIQFERANASLFTALSQAGGE